MNYLKRKCIFSLKYLTSLFECSTFTVSILTKTTMRTENGFRITTYKKKDLACLYCPNATARCAIRTLTRWIKRNKELYAALLCTGYNVRTRTFMPRQVSIIVRYLDEP